MTGASGFPEALSENVKNGALEYFCNTLVTYTIRGVHTTLNVIWDWEAPAGSGDTHYAVYKGTRARVEVRQGSADGHRPALYVVPNAGQDAKAILEAVRARVAAVAGTYGGVEVEEIGRAHV